ncbi:MAG: cell division protein FtsZ [Alphaproteobacteria bacterium]|nr:cell division protein FtsZ [Alphaproteobacteria bacterium]
MTLNLSAPGTETQLKPRIVVVGVGGAGCNAVNNMISANLEGVEFVVANTDAQSLALSSSERRIQLGINITNGLGAGARPDIGRAAAEESLDVIIDHLQGSHMAFIAAGMGGGTGTGAAPVIARAAREQGILTVGVVTKPFQFEGNNRMKSAEEGIEELQHFVDTLIVIPNQNLFRVCNEHTTFADAFCMADNVLHSGVRGVTDLMVMPGLINLDFADIRTVMGEMGKAMMGTGEASGEGRSIAAAEAAIANPLLDDVSMRGARGVLINITGGYDMTLFEVDEAANRIREEVDADANIIFGSTFDEKMDGLMRVSIVSTGIDADASAMPRSPMISLVHDADRSAKPQTTGGAGEAPADAGQTTPIASDPSAPMGTTTGGLPPVGSALTAEPLIVPDASPTASAPMGSTAAAQAMAEPAPVPEPRQPVQTAGQPFIPPRPTLPAAREPQLRAPQPTPNAIAEAAIENGAAQTEKRRGRSLFQKVTGAVNSLVTDEEQTAATPPPVTSAAQPAPTVSAPVAAPEMAQEPIPEPVAESAPEPAPEIVPEPTPEPAMTPAPTLTAPAPEPVPSPAPLATPAPQPAAAEPMAETATEPAVETSTETAPETPAAAPVQPSLTNLEPTAPSEAAGSDDDMLEIPAFLRRQAN